jgi:Icc-related predicted phosphoesterase
VGDLMKILAISDIHSKFNNNLIKYLKNNDIDLVLISGDLTDFGPLEFVNEFIENISDCGADVIAIPGNCDPAGICNAIEETESFCLHNKIIAYGDLIISGYGGSNPTPFDTPGEISDEKIYNDLYYLLKEYNDIANDDVKKITVLLTHAPPYNTKADLVGDNNHVGSQGVKKVIHEFQPNINICGHIHEAKSIDKVGETIIANPGILENNGAVLIDVDEELNYDLNLISLI